jgi:hypothetical protein
VDSLRLTGEVWIDRTHHDSGMIGPQRVKRDEVFPVQCQHCPPFRTRKFQDLAIGNGSIGPAGFAHGQHIVAQAPEFRHDRKREILVGVEACHYALSLSRIWSSISTRWERT